MSVPGKIVEPPLDAGTELQKKVGGETPMAERPGPESALEPKINHGSDNL